MSIQNVKLRFNMNKKNDRKAYEYLKNADASYSKTVISAVCGFIELSEIKKNEDAFLERVISTIKEETSKINPFGGMFQLVGQTAMQNQSAEKEDADIDNKETMLDFLDSF